MGEVDILRIIGVGEEDIEKYKELKGKMLRIFMWVMIGGIILISFVPLILFSGIIWQDIKMATLLIFIGAIPLIFLMVYMMIIGTKIDRELLKIIEKTWMTWPNGRVILNSKDFKILFAIGSIEAFIIVLIFAYTQGAISGMISSFIFLIIIPAFFWMIRNMQKYGLSMLHRVKGDVEEIADKISKSLKAEKKLMFKSANNRTSRIIPKLSNLEIWVFRDYRNREFIVIDIKGMKKENTSEVANIIAKIEKIQK